MINFVIFYLITFKLKEEGIGLLDKRPRICSKENRN